MHVRKYLNGETFFITEEMLSKNIKIKIGDNLYVDINGKLTHRVEHAVYNYFLVVLSKTSSRKIFLNLILERIKKGNFTSAINFFLNKQFNKEFFNSKIMYRVSYVRYKK